MCLEVYDLQLIFKMITMPFLEEFGKAFLPKAYRANIHRYLSKTGVKTSPYSIVGVLFYFSLFLTLGVMFIFIYPFIINYVSLNYGPGVLSSLLVGLLVFVFWTFVQLLLMVFFFLLGYFFLDLKIYKRIKEIEDALPDFLVLVSTNLKGGMGIEPSIWNSIKPRFGVLAEEITLVSKKVMTGHDISDALLSLADKYDSPELKRTMSLIVSEFDTGGKIAEIIDDIVANLKNTKKLKREMQSSVISYVIFISAIVIFIAPVLFALSYNLINFLTSFVERVSSSLSSGNVPGFISTISTDGVNPEDFKIFGYVATGTVAFMSSMIVSIIEKGDIRAGIKYIPIYFFVSLLVYHVALGLLSLFLGGISI